MTGPPFGLFQVLEFLSASSATLGQGLTRVARYFLLFSEKVSARIVREPPHTSFQLLPSGESLRLERIFAQFALATLVLRSRAATGLDWSPEAVRFAGPPAVDLKPYIELFGVEPIFDSPVTGLVLSEANWERAVPSRNSALFVVLDDHAAAQLRAAGEAAGLEARVQMAVTEAIRGGDPQLDAVARRLGFGARTLQRRLKSQGLSYADLLDETRRELAERYLQDPSVSIFEVSHLLAFSEQSAFNRAFKRWTGTTPASWRRGEPG